MLASTVQRTSHLGDAVDYQVQVSATDVILRVASAPLVRVVGGDAVPLVVAPEACVPLAGGDGGPTRAAG